MSDQGDAGSRADRPPRRAEGVASDVTPVAAASPAAGPETDLPGQVRELQARLAELEQQNVALLQTQAELEAWRERYEQAPVGHCTVSAAGLILEANLTAAALLGVERGALPGQPFATFVVAEDHDLYDRRRTQLLGNREPMACGLRLRRADGTAFWAHLDARAATDAAGTLTCRVALSDVSESRSQDEARDLAARLVVLANTPSALHECMAGLTAALQDWSGCEAVGIRLRLGSDYPYFETRGFPQAFVEAENHLCSYDASGAVRCDGAGHPWLDCMCGNVLCGRCDPSQPFFTTQGSFWTNSTTALLANTSDADRLARTRNRCHGEGYESVALVPLRVGTEVLGLLQFNDRRPGRFTARHVAHLERLAEPLAIALSRRQRQDGSRQSEARFRSYFDLPFHGVAITSPEKAWLEVNERLCGILGYPRDELLRLTWAELTHPDDLAADLARFQRLLAGEIENYQIEKRFVRKDGAVVWTRVAVGCVRQPDGRVDYVVALLEDITARRQAEEGLRLFKAVFDHASEACAISDPSGALIYANKAHERLFGRSLEAARKLHARDFFPPESVAVLKQEVVPRLWRGESWQGELDAFDASGRRFPLWVRGDSLRDASGGPSYTFGFMHDVSSRRTLEAQLRQAQKMESVGRLAGGVAHDFNNLLLGIMNYVELCLGELPAEHPVRGYLNEITCDAQRSADLTRQLLAFARRQIIAPKVFDLNDAVTNLLKMLRHLLGEDIDLVWRPGATTCTVKMDPSQVDQILANLTVNARDALRGAGKLSIEVRQASVTADDCVGHADAVPGEYVSLTVSDSGCGMDKETLAHLFEPFFTTKGVGEGTGLGLATVYGIVRQNGGFIDVHSQPGQGTTFRVYLPRCAPEEVPVPVPAAAPLPERPRGTETVLLVEDERSIRTTVRLSLQGLGYTVLPAADAAEALRLAAAHAGSIDLLITDVVMPGANGRELAERLLGQRPALKCLFMSGYTAAAVAHRGVVDDGVHFLAKPFSRDELARRVRAALDGAASAPGIP